MTTPDSGLPQERAQIRLVGAFAVARAAAMIAELLTASTVTAQRRLVAQLICVRQGQAAYFT